MAGAGVGAGTGSNDMGSADSKLNFRKAVIQLTTKTQVRPGPRPLPRPTCRAGGWAGPGGCANLAYPEMGIPAGLEGDTEARAGAEHLGLYPRAHSPSPPISSLLSREHLSPCSRCCHLRLTCAYFRAGVAAVRPLSLLPPPPPTLHREPLPASTPPSTSLIPSLPPDARGSGTHGPG